MGIRFIRGNSQTPKGHAIFFARSSGTIYCTYCIVPPIPMSIAKYLPPLFAAQLPPEELQEATSFTGMPIPPMLEEAQSMEYLERLAEYREDDLCDIGPLSSRDEGTRMQLAAMSGQEYGQLYSDYISKVGASASSAPKLSEPQPLDDMDAEELLLQTLSDRQKVAELGKLIGMARYALEGHDTTLMKDTQRRMQRIVDALPDKYRGKELIRAAGNPDEKGARLTELYLSRAYKLLDEEYADIPGIERSIRELE